MTTILVVGFGPFPGAPKNPSADLVVALGRRRRPALAGARIISTLLPTSYTAITDELPTLIREHDPDLMLFFGLATRTSFVRIETRAVNAASLVHPDAQGAKLATRKLVLDAPRELKVRAPVQQMIAAARTAGVPVRLSRDAGRYVCNAALFTSLDMARGNGRPARIAFVHIPHPRSHSPLRPRRRAARPTMTALIRAGDAALIALLASAGRG